MEGGDEGINVSIINSAGFNVAARQKGVELGALTLHEVQEELMQRYLVEYDAEIASLGYDVKIAQANTDRDDQDALGDLSGPSPQEIEDIKAILPHWLKHRPTAFIKSLANKIPESKAEVDHQLRFYKDPEQKSAHLYKMNTQELETMRDYLVENLRKGFIRPSKFWYSSPVLFVK